MKRSSRLPSVLRAQAQLCALYPDYEPLPFEAQRPKRRVRDARRWTLDRNARRAR